MIKAIRSQALVSAVSMLIASACIGADLAGPMAPPPPPIDAQNGPAEAILVPAPMAGLEDLVAVAQLAPSAAQDAPSDMPSPIVAGAFHQRGYGQLPMRFEPNQGQTDAAVQYLARGPGYQLFLTAEEAVLVLRQVRPEPVRPEPRRPEQGDPDQKRAAEAQTTPAAIRLRLTGAARNPAPVPVGQEPLPGYSNYLIGKDPAQWRTRVPHFAKIRYGQVYPGIDLVYYGNPQQLEYDFVLAPGADPDLIQMAYTGIERLEIDAAGDLVLHVPGGRMVQQAPRIWQEIDDERHPVEGRYVLHPAGDDQIAFQPDQADDAPDAPGDNLPLVGFQLAQYRPDLPLVIDPVVLSYASFLGGNSSDQGAAIAVDDAGQAYVTGYTWSTDFPVTAGAAYPANAGSWDVYVAKLNATGTGMVYATYLGGIYEDGGKGIAVDGEGRAYVTGYTDSDDFPVTAGAADSVYAGNRDAFVTQLSADGTTLDYASFLGGDSDEQGNGIAVDGMGHAYVTGYTTSSDFPASAGATHPSYPGSGDAFIVKVNTTGTALDYATYLGGSSYDSGNGIAVDAIGQAYVTGVTASDNFPVTPGVFDSGYGGYVTGVADAFVAKLDATGSALEYSTYLGGWDLDVAHGIAVDAAGQAYVTGYSLTGFPLTADAVDSYCSYDAFVAKVNATGTALEYATCLGGDNMDEGHSIAVDARGLAYVTGVTESNGFPTRYAPYPTKGFYEDAFVAALTPDGRGLVYSTFLGGGSGERGQGLALDPAGNAYVVGSTSSSDFPTTTGAFDSYLSSEEGFIAKLAIDGKLLLVTQAGGGSGLVSSAIPDGTIDCGHECSAIYPAGTAVRLLASTQPQSTFAGWGGDCASAGTALTCNLTLTGDQTVSARFEPRTDDVAISQGLDLDQSQPGIDWYQAGRSYARIWCISRG